MTPATPTPNSQLICHIDGAQTITVGQKSSFSCDVSSLGDLAQKKMEFSQPDTKANYQIQFLGSPIFNKGQITQSFTSYKVGHQNQSTILFKIDEQILKTAPLEFDVKSVMTQTAGSKPTPFPEVDPNEVPVPQWWWIMWGLVIAVVLILIAWKIIQIQKKRRKKAAEVVVANLTPQERFQAALRQLVSKGLHLQGDYKSFAVQLTFLIKKTLGSEMHFPAEDLTSEELLTTLERRHGAFYFSAGTSLASFLADLDRIKFATLYSGGWNEVELPLGFPTATSSRCFLRVELSEARKISSDSSV
jgi:hypothetical protein